MEEDYDQDKEEYKLGLKKPKLGQNPKYFQKIGLDWDGRYRAPYGANDV